MSNKSELHFTGLIPYETKVQKGQQTSSSDYLEIVVESTRNGLDYSIGADVYWLRVEHLTLCSVLYKVQVIFTTF
jgi:hypothetical protein